MSKRLSLLLIFVLMSLYLFGAEISFTYSVNTPELSELDSHNLVHLNGARVAGKVGEPSLPKIPVKLLLPEGETALAIEIIPENLQLVSDNAIIRPIQRPYPWSFSGEKTYNKGLEGIYYSEIAFTGNEETNLQTQYYRGHSVAYATISPFVYYPAANELYYYKTLTVNIVTGSTEKSSTALTLLKDDFQTIENLKNLIQNQNAVPIANDYRDREEDYELLIITVADFVDYLQDYIELKTQLGWRSKVITVEEIVADFTGTDTQEQIRNCIIDEYSNYGVTHLLLAGDDENIPHRGLYDNAGGWDNDNDIPADIYFSNLDGTWNDDNDNSWGEIGEDDLLGELAVGRFACDTADEFNNLIQKIVRYQQDPVVSNIKNTMMVGEDLGWNVWGKDYKEEIHNGSTNWGYETVALPESYNVTTLYDYDQTWNPISDLMYELNNGKNLVNHLGHASTTYAMKLDNPDLTTNNCTNNGVENGYYIIYSQGCYCGAFDNRTSYGNYVEDCISEVWTSLETGAVAMVTNSRYGWGDLDTTDGSSQHFDRQFFDAIFGEDIFKIGDAQKDAKEDNIPYIDNEANRWCFYCSNLFGDPTMDIWTEEPTEVSVNHSGALIIGQTSYQADVTSDTGIPLQGATVSLSRDGMCLGKGVTGGSGSVMVHFYDDVLDPGNMTLHVSGHNINYWEDNVEIIPPTGPYLLISGYDVLAGDDDYIESGEHVEMELDVYNIGVETASDIQLNLTCNDTYITLDDANESITQLTAGQTETITAAFSFDISTQSPDYHPFALTIEMAAGDNTWSNTIEMIAFEPNCFAVSPPVFEIELGTDETIIDTLFLSNTTQRVIDYSIRTEEITRNVEGSYVVCSTESFTPGETADWVFTAYNMSLDNEWVTDVNITFPAGVTVNEASDFTGASGGVLEWDETIGEAVTLNWHGATALGYGYLHDNQAAMGWVNVTTNDAFAGNIELIYEFIGDGYGEEPHTTTGSITLDYPLSWISLDSSSGVLTGGETHNIPAIFNSSELTTGWHNCQIVIHDGSRDVKKIPVSLHVVNTLAEEVIPENLTGIVGNYPNPFNPSAAKRGPATTILLSVAEDVVNLPVIEIYNIKGQLIKTLPVVREQKNEGGLYQVNWMGKDSKGRQAGSGIYLYKLQGENSSVHRMILLK